MAERPESAELRRVRRRIDVLDRRIVRLLNERARLGLEAGATKAEHGRGVRDAEREDEVLRRVCEANEGPLPADEIQAMYRRLMTATRRLEAADRRGEAGDGRRGAADPGPATDPHVPAGSRPRRTG